MPAKILERITPELPLAPSNIPFAALGFKERVAVFDLVEMAELDLDADALTLSVPAGGERRFRLDALPVAEKGGAKR